MLRSRAVAAAIVLAAMVTLPGCDGSLNSDLVPAGSGGHGPSVAVNEANVTDITFVGGMIPHHVRAVEMADLILAKEGIDERVVALAEQIISAQQPEIDLMEGMLAFWGAATPTPEAPDHMGHGEGMMSERDMQALENATGAEAAQLFLTQMIEHHRSAITMAENETHNGRNPDALDLAEDIIAQQTMEIDSLNDLLATF